MSKDFLFKQLSMPLNIQETVPFPNTKKYKFTAIDIFAGIGGTRLAFHKTKKVKFVFSSELDKYAQKTYKANFGDLPKGDITKIPSSHIPNHDILIGVFKQVKDLDLKILEVLYFLKLQEF